MQFLKQPQLEQLMSLKNDEKAKMVVQITQNLRQTIPIFFKISFERLKDGPCGENIFLKPDVYKPVEDYFECQIDIPQQGIFKGAQYTQSDSQEALISLYQAVVRLTSSKSMFLCIL